MKTLLCFASLTLTLCFTASAYADSVIVPVSTGLAGNAGTVNGSVTIDSTAGTVTDLNINVAYGGSTFSFTTITWFYPQWFTGDDLSEAYVGSADSYGNGLLISFDTPTFVGFNSSDTYCTAVAPCSPFISFFNPVSGSGAMQFSPAPEPSSLILLGTGLLGAAGAARRRFRQA